MTYSYRPSDINGLPSTTTTTTHPLDERHARMSRAFDLVSPATHGKHWKASIDATISDPDLCKARVTLADVVDSVLYFTGTSAKAVHATGVPPMAGPGCYWRVTAPGYWAGPCN